MFWLIFKILTAYNRAEEWLWDAWIWVKIRVRPDKRPASVILAEVKERLEQMPAAKEIHEAHALIEKVERSQG